MSVFVVTSFAPNPSLAAKVAATYPTDHFILSDSSWFVADENVTPAQVCDKIGVRKVNTTTGYENVVVTRVQGYFGFGSNALWQWLSLKGATP